MSLQPEQAPSFVCGSKHLPFYSVSVRVRFAPSPTGYLHIGSARTALFNWLYARHTGGTFILRIEDTDAARNTQEAVDVILEGLRWLGLDWDEGPLTGAANGPSKGSCGPYFQSQRSDIYRKRVEELKQKGMAYDHEGAVKFRMQREPVLISDLVVGDVRRELTDREEIDPDFVIVRSDGQPVFHLVNVIDDLEMGITHVIRGEDHLTNTAKHIALFRAFGVEPPKYAHIPLILNPGDGSKMSKRDQGSSLAGYFPDFAPEAVFNYLYLLGWSPKENREVLPQEEVIRLFDLPQILRHNARFDSVKLHWLNVQHFCQMSLPRFVELAVPALKRAGVNPDSYPAEYVAAALATCKEKVKLLSDAPKFAAFYFIEEVAIDFEAARKELSPDAKAHATAIRDTLLGLSLFDADTLAAAFKKLAGDLKVKAGLLVHPTRLACTGSSVGPSLYHLMEVLGKERVVRRMERFLEKF